MPNSTLTTTTTPRLFAWAGRPRSLSLLAAVAVVSCLAMLPAMATMSDHGISLTSFEFAGTAAASRAALADLGPDGTSAAWWQLALDTPFLIAYGLLLAGACTAVARRAERTARPTLRRAAALVAWFGPAAATADLVQNASLALILSGHAEHPWPRLAAVCGIATAALMATGLLFALAGTITTRSPRPY